MLRRIGLFMATNLAVVFVLQIVLFILNAFGLMPEGGMRNYIPLLVMSAVFGFAGSLISLMMSKTLAKRRPGTRIIDNPANETEQWIYETVKSQAQQAGIGMPEVAIYDAPEMNAFATGARRDAALVAVSTGLLRSMERNEVEAVLGHEIAHVANGDMVTLTLIQGVVNTFVIFISRILGSVIDNALSRGRRSFGRRGPGYMIGILIGQVVLGFMATVIVRWFSRWREFRADAGGAKLTSPQDMAAALDRLRRGSEPSSLPDSMAAMGIIGGASGLLAKLTRTHPPLEDRIARLQAM